ncbi:MAG: Do family serine endopeptidase [Acidobacteria bacterium]|nr:Do family serine endopeptidase [Acidobacteriota bacterium]
MYQLPNGANGEAERMILRRLRVWIAALAVACLVIGASVGALLAGRNVVAQGGASAAQIARAPEALSASFAEIASRVEPAVVNIDTVAAPDAAAAGKGDDDEDSREGNDNNGNNPLMDMFRKQMRRPSRGVGSGFIVDAKGYILTNKHVVEDATRITVRLQSGEILRGTVVGEDSLTDLAVIKVNSARDLPVVKLGDSSTVQVGDWVLAIGSPFGLDQTVTAGIISTLERQTPLSNPNFQRFLQTDAAINRGNSGGPLVNMRGEVIGVNSQIATSTGDYNGIGFALPSNETAFVYRQLVESGKVKRGYLGVYLDTVKAEYARVFNLAEAKGAIITDMKEGPAQRAGVQVGDIVVELNGRPVVNSQDLVNRVASTPVGQTITLAYLRDVNGKMERRTVSLPVGERPLTAAEGATTPEDGKRPTIKKLGANAGDKPRLGLKLSELTTQLANERGLKNVRGLLVTEVDPSGIAADADIREDMVVQKINRVPVNTIADFTRVMEGLKFGDAVVMNLVVRRGDGGVQQTIVQFTYQ